MVMSDSETLIDVQNVYKTFQKTHALNGVSIQFQKGRQYAIHGASGSGKSTLLYIMGGLDRPSKGKVIVDGNDLSKLSDKELALYRNQFVGFVFQFHFLLPSIKCLDNILLPAQISGKVDKSVEQRSRELADLLKVSHCLDKFPYELSGGEQQRINIIRALSMRPKLLLCDEPTGNLDSQNSATVTQLIKDLAKEFQATLVVVTHDPKVRESFSNSLFMQDGKLLKSSSHTDGLPPVPPMG